MRTLKIRRPKRVEAALTKLIVEIDGNAAGKLSNGAECTISIDERAHELSVHGGMLSAKSFSGKLSIPAGAHSYAFQIDMLSVSGSSGYKPMLRPCGDAPLKDSTRLVLLLGGTLTAALLDANLRAMVTRIPDARLQLIFEPQQWRLDLCAAGLRKALLTQPYSQFKGSLLGAAINAVEHGDLQTPEGREKLANQIWDEYLCHLPECRRTGLNEYALKLNP